MKNLIRAYVQSAMWLGVFLASAGGSMHAANEECLLLGGGGTELLFTLEEAYNDGITNAAGLAISACGDLCFIRVVDENGFTVALYDASNVYSGPFFTVEDAISDGITNAEALDTNVCGDRCLIEVGDSGNDTIALYDASDVSSPLFTLEDAYSDGITNAQELTPASCSDRCIIAVDTGGNIIVAFYDASDVYSGPLFTVADAINDGLTDAVRLLSDSCGDRCLISVLDSNTRIIAFYDASDVYSGPFFTLEDAYNDGITDAEGFSSISCGGRCLILVQDVNFFGLALYDASDVYSGPFFTLEDAINDGLTDAVGLSANSCGNRCLISVLDANFDTIAFYDAGNVSSPLFTLEDAYNDGLTDAAILVSAPCGDRCFIRVLDDNFNTIALYNALNVSSPLFSVEDAKSDGFTDAESLRVQSCGDLCVIEVDDSGNDTVAFYDASDVSSPLFTLDDAYNDGFTNVDELDLDQCGDLCLIEIEDTSNNEIAFYDISDVSSPLFSLEDAKNDGFANAEDLIASTCGDLCVILVEDNNGDEIALYDARNVSNGPFFTVEDAKSDGFTNAEGLNVSSCGDRCLIRVRDANNTIAIYDVAGTSVDLTISGLSDLAVCRDKEFCYELTVTNSDTVSTGAFTLNGLLDASWDVKAVRDCGQNPAVDYDGPDSGIWTNTQNALITFDQTGSGTWSIPNLDPTESLCIELCVVASEVKNAQLGITASLA